MLINYDRKVINVARRVYNSPTAIQRDMSVFLADFKYLGNEARDIIREMVDDLPTHHNNIR